MARPKKPFPDSVKRFSEHLPKGKDVTLIVLKTHLLVEVELNELLELRLPHPASLYRSRFSFVQRLRVLEAISIDPEIHLLAKAIQALNELRNSLAHQLETPDFKLSAVAFIDHAYYAAYDGPSRLRRDRGIARKEGFTVNSLKSAAAIVIGRLSMYKSLDEKDSGGTHKAVAVASPAPNKVINATARKRAARLPRR